MTSAKDKINEQIQLTINKAARIVIKNIKLQGFVDTGRLIDSVKGGVEDLGNITRAFITMNDYGFILNEGVKPENVPFTPGSHRGGTSKYIQALINWARRKFGLSLRQAVGRAFAIANIHKKQGIASRNSIRFSRTGKRKGFLNEAVKEIEATIGITLRKNIGNGVFSSLLNEFRNGG